jgi:hypothetical protein
LLYCLHEANAKECNSDDDDNNNDENNNSDDDSTTCANQHGSNGHSTTSTKGSTPFLLSLPFPWVASKNLFYFITGLQNVIDRQKELNITLTTYGWFGLCKMSLIYCFEA